MVSITKKFEFSASHRYWVENWSNQENERVFGEGVSPYGHGHNYELHVTVSGPVDEDTGMIINLSILKKIVKTILNDFDHKFLNLDNTHFKNRQPSTENIALVLFDLIEEKLSALKDIVLQRIRLYERHDIYADVWREAEQ